jgi:AAHS family 4-hydroxybenzoate transporter-like MFS transporter
MSVMPAIGRSPGLPTNLTAGQIWTVALCALTFAIEGYDIQTMALVIPRLSSAWAVSPASFSWSISAMVLSSALSNAFLAPFGDVYGRKRIIAIGLALMGICVGATASSSTILQFEIWRFLSGIGFGATAPNVMALIIEQLPRNRRAFLLTLSTVNISIGGLIGAVSAPWIIQSLGWPWIFIAGGVPAILIALVFFLTVVEAAPTPGVHPRRAAPAQSPTHEARSVPTVRDLLARPRLGVTLSLWIMWTLNSIVMFLMLSWIPTLLSNVGWSIGDASRGAAMLYLGGIPAGLLFTWLLDRGRGSRVLIGSYAATTVAFLLFMTVPPAVAPWSLFLLPIGASLIGGHYALNAIAATVYPNEIRATGVGWAAALSRVGSISGSLIGGLMIHLGMSTVAILSVLAIPAAICILLLMNLHRARQRELNAVLAAER